MIPQYDVIIVGASFAGLTLAHHLPSELSVLVLEAKPTAGATVESTGLITVKTRSQFASFFDIDAYITNPITSICVVAPGFKDYFVSTISEPWIYQTDTRGLVKQLAAALPANVTLRTGIHVQALEAHEKGVKIISARQGMLEEKFSARFFVGADGSRSTIARLIPSLDQNKKFLFGFEEVFFGEVYLGPEPEKTISHFRFGEFSLGYGGWISPTTVNGRKAFRIGLAKLPEHRGDAKKLIREFKNILVREKMIHIEGDPEKPDYVFGSMIPIEGVLSQIAWKNVLLLGDAAGFCGAFAADGIKGSVVSGKEAGPLIARYLSGEEQALTELRTRMNHHDDLMGYYRRQIRYRWLWDRMKSDRTFRAMYDIIEAEKETFVDQFCDAKDKRKSLTGVVLKWRHVPKLVKYAGCLGLDLFS